MALCGTEAADVLVALTQVMLLTEGLKSRICKLKTEEVFSKKLDPPIASNLPSQA